MQINKDTKKFISIAQRPGTFGLRFHNEGYELLGLNYVYFPLKVGSNELESVIQVVKNNFNGCSVSMPHKVKVMKYLDALDDSASKTGAVNTILRQQDSSLKGYNTDYYGAKRAIAETFPKGLQSTNTLMLGAGGVAKAIGLAIRNLGGKLTISNRTQEKAKSLANRLGGDTLDWEERNNTQYDLLINATSIGMGEDKQPISLEAIDNFSTIMDVVVTPSPRTTLMQNARSKNKGIIPGNIMTTYQAAKQFEIYTGRTLPETFIDKILGENNES